MAIYTKFGTLFTFTTPVNWDTGWVSGQRDGDEGIKEYHVTDLRADGGLNEIQAASDLLENNETAEIHFCRDCNLPMEAVEQPSFVHGKPSITIVTCRNKDCTLWGVTLSTDGYSKLTDEQWAEYRKMVVNLKATIAKRGGES